MTNPWARDEYAEGWSAGTGPKNPLRDEQIDVALHLAAVRRPERILDLGCGPGEIAARLLETCQDAELVGSREKARLFEKVAAVTAPGGLFLATCQPCRVRWSAARR